MKRTFTLMQLLQQLLLLHSFLPVAAQQGVGYKGKSKRKKYRNEYRHRRIPVPLLQFCSLIITPSPGLR